MLGLVLTTHIKLLMAGSKNIKISTVKEKIPRLNRAFVKGFLGFIAEVFSLFNFNLVMSPRCCNPEFTYSSSVSIVWSRFPIESDI